MVDELLLHKCAFPFLESNFMKHTRVCAREHTHTLTKRHTNAKTTTEPSQEEKLKAGIFSI